MQFLKTKNCSVSLPRGSLLNRVTAGDSERHAFEEFSTEIVGILKDIWICSDAKLTSSCKREKLWSFFHQACLFQLPGIWEKFLSALHINQSDDILQQSVNQKIIEMILPTQLSTSAQTKPKTTIQLNKDELNALHYACGYVPHQLIRKYQKRVGCKCEKFVECLKEMALHGEATCAQDHDFQSYTRQWVEKVDRGGLFHLNDTAFDFFVSVEREVQAILPTYMSEHSAGSKDDFKDKVIRAVIGSEDVHQNWALISHCLDSEDDALELLEDIVTLWVTVRGFSITETWLETYKAKQKKNTKKKPGLRTGLSCSS